MYSWSDHPLKPGCPNKAVYIQELRKALDEKRKEMGLTPADWSEPIKIGEPKKFSHTQQLMLACEDTAKRYGYDSYQDILKREWTPIQQGGPYKFQIVNDLRQVIDGLVWLGFEERFPGIGLDLKKWEVIEKSFPWYVNELLCCCKEISGGIPETTWEGITSFTTKEGIVTFPLEFIIEWDWFTYLNMTYNWEKNPGIYIQILLPWGHIGFRKVNYNDETIDAHLDWGSNNSLDALWHRPAAWRLYPGWWKIKLVVEKNKQTLYMIKEWDTKYICIGESYGPVKYLEPYIKIKMLGYINILTSAGWGCTEGRLDNIIVRKIKE